jgi:hypothetical protein
MLGYGAGYELEVAYFGLVVGIRVVFLLSR